MQRFFINTLILLAALPLVYCAKPTGSNAGKSGQNTTQQEIDTVRIAASFCSNDTTAAQERERIRQMLCARKWRTVYGFDYNKIQTTATVGYQTVVYYQNGSGLLYYSHGSSTATTTFLWCLEYNKTPRVTTEPWVLKDSVLQVVWSDKIERYFTRYTSKSSIFTLTNTEFSLGDYGQHGRVGTQYVAEQ